MRACFIPALIITLALSACNDGPDGPVRWTHYSSREHGFSVAIPEQYTVFQDQSAHAFGEHPGVAVYWRKPGMSLSELGLKLLSAGYFEVPELRRYPADYVLDSFVRKEAGMGGTDEGRVLGLSMDSVQGHPARRLTMMIDNGKSDSLYLCEQFILAGPRMYHLRTNGYKATLDTPSMRRFLESFRLL